MQSINAMFQYGNRLIMAAWFKRYFSHGCNAPFTVVQSDVIPLLQSSLSFPLFFVFQPIGIMPPIVAHAEC